MANPFLVLGGVAVGVITAGIGVLAVPGWIDSANDSAAINDLGNIRGAESAAVLQLGEYTDDFAVLRSGELGVKFQKSDGVTIIGLKADTNESWCAADRSKSGRFFAASNEQARIATGPGARSAMVTAGCDPDLIQTIIDEATADVGDAGSGGGSWVGESSGAGGSNPGGGTTNANDEGGISSSDEKAATAAALIGSADQVAYTSSGLVVYTGGSLSDSFFRVAADGSASKFNITGDLEDARLSSSDLRSDGADGLYLSAFTADANTWYPNAIYRIAADGSSRLITTVNNPDPDAGGRNIIYNFSVGADGEVYFMGTADEYVDGWGMWGGMGGMWKVDQATTKSTRVVKDVEAANAWQATRGDFAVAADGTVFAVANGGTFNFGVTRISGASIATLPQSTGDGWFNPTAILLDPAGNLYAQDDLGGDRFVYRVNTSSGELTQLSMPGDANWLQLDSASFAPDGTAYNVDDWGMIAKITSSGQKYAITMNE